MLGWTSTPSLRRTGTSLCSKYTALWEQSAQVSSFIGTYKRSVQQDIEPFTVSLHLCILSCDPVPSGAGFVCRVPHTHLRPSSLSSHVPHSRSLFLTPKPRLFLISWVHNLWQRPAHLWDCGLSQTLCPSPLKNLRLGLVTSSYRPVCGSHLHPACSSGCVEGGCGGSHFHLCAHRVNFCFFLG